jgi:hypothetical protein
MSQPTGLPTPEEKRTILEAYRRQYGLATFVETGTLFGDTVEAMRPVFQRVVSIELSEELGAKARERFAGCGNVTILQGDSGQVLPRVLEMLTGPALFWLDGHYSGDFQSKARGFVRTARGELQTPVMQELGSVLADKEPGHVVLIDDARLFDGTNDYPTLDALRTMVGAKRRMTVERDIIRVVP